MEPLFSPRKFFGGGSRAPAEETEVGAGAAVSEAVPPWPPKLPDPPWPPESPDPPWPPESPDPPWPPESPDPPWPPSPRIRHGLPTSPLRHGHPSPLTRHGSQNGRHPGGLLSCPPPPLPIGWCSHRSGGGSTVRPVFSLLCPYMVFPVPHSQYVLWFIIPPSCVWFSPHLFQFSSLLPSILKPWFSPCLMSGIVCLHPTLPVFTPGFWNK